MDYPYLKVRLLWHSDVLEDYKGEEDSAPHDKITFVGVSDGNLNEKANLVSSLCVDGKHRPLYDFDGPANGRFVAILPSSTSGHYHAYGDEPLTWDQWRDALGSPKTGASDENWRKHSLRRGQAFLRTPWTKKDKKVVDDEPS
jgi:hypothetical protein